MLVLQLVVIMIVQSLRHHIVAILVDCNLWELKVVLSYMSLRHSSTETLVVRTITLK